jgi:hypothetical protein
LVGFYAHNFIITIWGRCFKDKIIHWRFFIRQK